MVKQIRQEALQAYFKGKKDLSKQELWEYCAQKIDIADEIGFFWFLFELQQEGVLHCVGKDTYRLMGKSLKRYEPYLSGEFYKLNFDLAESYQKYGIYQHCIWETQWFSEFMVHQPTRNLTIVEVEKEAVDTIFHHLKDVGYKDVFSIVYKKDAETLLEKYVFEAENPIIVTKILSGSRLIKQNRNPEMLLKPAPSQSAHTHIALPRLEKLLVDLYFDDMFLLAYKGAEQDNIFRNAIDKYQINFRTLFAYASRRSEKKAHELRKYLTIHFQEEIQNTVI